LLGNAEAIEFAEVVCGIAHVWDDLIDCDNDLDDSAIHRAFWDALIRLPRLPFYARNFVSFQPLLETAIINWQIANELEQSGTKPDLHIAFVLRSSYADLILMAMRLVGGDEYARQAGVEMRRTWSSEGFDAYCAALENEMRRA